MVKDIYITHRHPDHILFLGGLIRRMFRNNRTEPLTIYCPTNAFYRLQGFIRFANPRGIPPFIKFQTFIPEDPEHMHTRPSSQTDVWEAAACHTTMTAGYAFSQGDRKIVFSPDTSPNCPTLIALAENATGWFHDCTFPSPLHTIARRKGHSSPKGSGSDAAKAGVKKLILIHTSRVRSLEQDNLVKGARKHFDGEVEVAKDNSVFEF